jgi:hypothetical protein
MTTLMTSHIETVRGQYGRAAGGPEGQPAPDANRSIPVGLADVATDVVGVPGDLAALMAPALVHELAELLAVALVADMRVRRNPAMNEAGDGATGVAPTGFEPVFQPHHREVQQAAPARTGIRRSIPIVQRGDNGRVLS